jgi:predicted nucleic acid-binding protein
MIVLVDTSVWIRFLSNRVPYAAELDRLLSRDEVSGHAFVYGELLIGDVGGRQQLLDNYEKMHQAPVVPHDDVVAFVQGRRLHGRSADDASLLAPALVGRLKCNGLAIGGIPEWGRRRRAQGNEIRRSPLRVSVLR